MENLGRENKQNGFSLIESIIGVAIFVFIVICVYTSYNQVFNMVNNSRLRIAASALANEQFEIIRNLPYADVGIVSGLPLGKILRDQVITRDNIPFAVKTTIRSMDDPFDGLTGGSPNDLSPADYKSVELNVSCTSCKNFLPVNFTTTVSPKNLETASTNGALFIRVFDANGQAVQGANVHIENNQASPAIIIDETTNNAGMLQIVDAPPGVEAYEITVSKGGYSTEMTYPTGAVGNPNPTKPHVTVILQQVTQLSFAIDKVSAINVASVTDTCVPVGNIDFSLQGSKLIGTSPDVFKYNQNHTTDASGIENITNMEWDNYSFYFTDAGYDLAGAIPLIPLNLIPNSTQNLQFVVTPKNPLSVLITVKDASTQLPLASTSVKLEKTGYVNTLITGRGFLRQTDWSSGDGQVDFTDVKKYFSSDGNVDTVTLAGEITLKNDFINGYSSSGELISSTFDTGSASNFYQIIWQPQNQPLETGSDSVRLKIATNNDKTTWNFLGPDGTASTFYTLSDTNINAVHNGNRYLRYKVFLQTADIAFTPSVSDIAFTFTSLCVPPGQVIFSGLAADSYTITVSKSGYQTFTDTVAVSSPWQQREIILNP